MHPAIAVPIYAGLTIINGAMTEFCIRHWPFTANAARKIRPFWLIPHLLISLAPVAGAFLDNSHIRFALMGVGNIYLGYFLYYGVTLALLMLFAGLATLITSRRFSSLYGIILCLSLVCGFTTATYGMFHAQEIQVRRYDIAVDKPGKDMTVVFVADLHLSVNSELSTTVKMVDLINRENPDLVLVGGDIFTSSYEALFDPQYYSSALSNIRSRLGVYGVYGNHDVDEPLLGGFAMAPLSEAFRTPRMEQFMKDSGFTMLSDETVLIDGFLQLIGRVDGEKAGDGTNNRMSAAELLKGIDRTKPVLVLEHEPREYRDLKEAGADVVLSGHTHNGQFFPGNLIVPLFNENGWGYKVVDGLQTLVTAGIGYYGPPIRVGTDSEISVIRLTFQQESGA
ncbi:MAG: metallophosphoesterase [Clostridia bacterium]|nr:metallophosphoesterase [Clostridia bacterium]